MPTSGSLFLDELIANPELELKLHNLHGKEASQVEITENRVQVVGLSIAGFTDHLYSERVQLFGKSEMDYLLTLGSQKAGKYMEVMKGLSWETGKRTADLLAQQEKALREAWNLDSDTLDRQWTAWVLKEYKNPSKRRR